MKSNFKIWLWLPALLWSGQLFAQPIYNWVQQFKSTSSVYPSNTAFDKEGNIYVCGGFENQMSIGDTTLYTFQQDTVNFSFSDMFLVKFDSMGNLLWALQGNAMANAYGYTVRTDKWNNVYVVVDMWSDCIINGDTVGRTSYGFCDMLLLKYDKDGHFLWYRKSLGWGFFPIGLCTDHDGNVIVSGYNNTSNSFEGDTISPTYQESCTFIKYSSAGDLLWTTQIDNLAQAYELTTDENNNVYATGYSSAYHAWFGSEFYFDNPLPGRRIFVAKISPYGIFKWARMETLTTPGYTDQGCTIQYADGYVYAGGYIRATPSQYANYYIPDTGSYYSKQVCYVAKYDTTGDLLWFQYNYGAWMSAVDHLTVSSSGIVTALSGGYHTIYFPDTTIYLDVDQAYYYELNGNGNIININSYMTCHYGGGFTSDIYKDRLIVAGLFVDTAYLPFDTIISEAKNAGVQRNGFLIQLHDKNYLTAVENISLAQPDKFTFFPNPASNAFIISVSENGFLIITNELGQTIESFSVPQGQQEISSSDFPDGTYFLTFHSDKFTQTKKLLIKH